ncbi:MAG TPA: hypothetical protein VGE17_00390 [Methylophilus sp.]
MYEEFQEDAFRYASLTEAALAQHILYLAEDIVAENDIQQIYNAEELSLEVV